MPPKRKPRNDMASDTEESDVVELRRPATSTLPGVMKNIEKLKAKRDRGRKDVAAKFDAYVAEKKNAIAEHYASEAEKRVAEATALLTRYAEVVARRASIERSIEKLVSDSANDAEDLKVILQAVYDGRSGQWRKAAGSFASITPKGAASASTMNPHHGAGKYNPFDTNGRAQLNGHDEQENDHDGGDAKHEGEEQDGVGILRRIFW
ncbi:hypothetical protein GQX73_g10032 [Xylaria multiplex]|uniref:Uncharacterized protein n=1 Tax=Xylaria multiplex TaxID=323545 RepID=A0A7C8IHE7_9PEZI|nr:hypothetical protein GQX73_g10032 [Xylaria multiplex]